ncbi:MAG: copper-binding protein [Pseudomonadota bacterium]
MKHFIVFAMLLAPAAFAQTVPPVSAEVVRAKVVKVDAPRGKVTLNHAPIKSIQMEAMTMPFKVKDAAMLKKIKTGDKVRFSVAVEDDELLITRIEAVK